jgi:hypothetical protein
MLPQIVTRTAGSIASRMGYIRTDVITRCLVAIILTNFKCLEAQKFKFLLNENLNNFITDHTTDTKIPLLVPLYHRNIFQTHWANLKSPDLAINKPESNS